MDLKGLTNDEVAKRQKEYGKNELFIEKKTNFLLKILLVFKEPMFILLFVTATIYFILGEPRDGIIMLIFVIAMITIETIQEWKTDKTLKALKDLSSPKVLVIRNNKEILINSVELVPDDIMILYEGVKIPADGIVVKTTGLCVDESSLTGESEGKWKKEFEHEENNYFKDYLCYAGTICLQGKAYVKVQKIGKNTEYGKIGNAVLNGKDKKTSLEEQTDKLVKICAFVAFGLFILVGILTFIITIGSIKERIIDGILSGVTLAMAMIPEEFPVILTVFLSMGAWRLAKRKSIVKKLPAVETLGAVSVLCVDKTGTITKNKMEVNEVCYRFSNELNKDMENEIARVAACSSLPDAFDTMEIAIWNYAKKNNFEIISKLNYTFPFTNETKMMGNVYYDGSKYTLYMKGAYESILSLCSDLDDENIEQIKDQIKVYSLKGLRVLALASETSDDEITSLENRKMKYIGLITFIDPERDEIKEDIKTCHKAGIRVIMITGDNGYTASAIAKKIGISNYNNFITGLELDQMNDEELKEKIKTNNIFSRVIPEHKMRIVKCLQELGEVVAMTGDGVNDAPALKKADIGIAMGMRGSEVSREAADLVLLDDNFHTIVNTIKDGRRIYNNIKKAVGYVFTIHIPIALASLVAPVLGITTESLFLLPLHVVLMELLIDPTCSVVLERQPADDDIMDMPPRKLNSSLVQKQLLTRSVLQGLVLFIASFGLYYYFLNQVSDVQTARSLGLFTLFLGNVLLVNVNASEHEYAFQSFKKLCKDKVIWIINIATIVIILCVIYTPLNHLFKLDPLKPLELLLGLGVCVISVFWVEILKLFKNLSIKRKNKKNSKQI